MNTNGPPSWKAIAPKSSIFQEPYGHEQWDPPAVAITINIHTAKPSVLLIAAAWVITISIAITAVGIIVEKTIIWTASTPTEDNERSSLRDTRHRPAHPNARARAPIENLTIALLATSS